MASARVLFKRFLKLNRQKRSAFVDNIQLIDLKVGGRFWRSSCVKLFSDKLTILSELFARQCNVIAAQRVRRTSQIVNLYQRLYGGQSELFIRLGEFFRSRAQGKTPLALAAALFSMKEEKIENEEIERCIDDLKVFFDCTDERQSNSFQQWEKLLDQPNFKLWRSPVPGSDLYQYRVYGTYDDISARAFYHVQLDLEYRKQWDGHVIKLEQVELDNETGSEVIHWVTKYPVGFMYNRDYVYVRRCKVDKENNLMVISARAVDHPECPVNPDVVRVARYKSQMVIRPHTNFDSNGFEYVMSYYDEPQLSVPTRVINWMTYQSLPGFLKELYDAAKKLKEWSTSSKGNNSYTDSWYQSSHNSQTKVPS